MMRGTFGSGPIRRFSRHMKMQREGDEVPQAPAGAFATVARRCAWRKSPDAAPAPCFRAGASLVLHLPPVPNNKHAQRDRVGAATLRLGGVAEADKLLMPGSCMFAAVDLSIGDIEAAKNEPLLIVRDGSAAALLQRQAGLGAVERLNPELVVDAEDCGM